MESLKEDKTTLLYFYQQVKVFYLQSPGSYDHPLLGRWKDKACILKVSFQESSLGDVPWSLVSYPNLLPSHLRAE